MKKKDRALFIETKLAELFPTPKAPLNSINDFTFLVAVLLSAQCTDQRVNTVTPFLFAKAKNPFEMKNIPLNLIYKILKKL